MIRVFAASFVLALGAAMQMFVSLAVAALALLLMYVVRWATGLGWWESFALVALGRTAMIGVTASSGR